MNVGNCFHPAVQQQ